MCNENAKQHRANSASAVARSAWQQLTIAVVLILVVSVAPETKAQPSPRIGGTAAMLTWADLARLPLPVRGRRIRYGSAPQQFGELRLPPGNGPFPVFVVIHGGCWQTGYDYVYMTRLLAWLARHGVATWTIEYRRLGDKGGGWPGTFLDVADATDALRHFAVKSHLDTERVYTVGHSAGAQLALWLASRTALGASSELYRKDPIPIRGVLGLAAITDLRAYRKGPPDSCHSSVEPLLGGTPETVANRYAETSPRERLPLGIPQVFIQGDEDTIVDPASVDAYAAAASKAGDQATVLPLTSAGHFDCVVPLPQTTAVFDQALELLVGRER